MDLTDQTDDALHDLIRRAEHELHVRAAVVRLAGLAPCSSIWGPGPPYYCIPRCTMGYQGHDGPCVPDKTKSECRKIWDDGFRAMTDNAHGVRLEAEQRLG